MPTIILERDWTNRAGILKREGTEITFSRDSEELQEIINEGYAHLKLSLPEDLPNKAQLEQAGYDSVQSLSEISDWTSIKGIGEKGAEELDKYFNINQED